MEIKDYNFQKKKKIHPEKCCHRYQVQQHSNTHTHKSKLMKAMAALTLITGTQSKNRNPRKLCPNITGYVLTLEGREEQ